MKVVRKTGNGKTLTLVDHTGQTIGGWKVLWRASNKGGNASWTCRHQCNHGRGGAEQIIQGRVLRRGPARYCEVCRPENEAKAKRERHDLRLEKAKKAAVDWNRSNPIGTKVVVKNVRVSQALAHFRSKACYTTSRAIVTHVPGGPNAAVISVKGYDRRIALWRVRSATTAPAMERPDVIKLRQRLGFSQKEFAVALGVSYESIKNWETRAHAISGCPLEILRGLLLATRTMTKDEAKALGARLKQAELSQFLAELLVTWSARCH